jgi:hypothetical protein
MIQKILQAAELPSQLIQELASQTNVKLKFPEDISSNLLCKEVLTDYRENGFHHIKHKNKK